jgi:hypothetical protein
MKKLLGILVLGLLWCNIGHTESKWKIEEDQKYFQVRKEGTIQKGDHLTFLISKNDCNAIEQTFTFYTLTKNPSIKQIENTKVGVSTLGQNMLFDLKYVISAKPSSERFNLRSFMSGYIALISAGVYPIEKHLEFLSKHEELDVKLKYIFSDFENKTGWTGKRNASDFFDILENKWKLAGMSEAIKEAQSKCLK